MKRANGEDMSRRGPRTLAIDVGGTGVKISVLDAGGRMMVKRVRVATPEPRRPAVLLRTLARLADQLPAFDRISIGFPGVVRDGCIVTAPHFDREAWRGYPLEAAASRRFGKPARVLNDAEVQGLGIIAGRGLEVVLTLGTGVGSAVFREGRLAPHLELAQHPIHQGKTYDEYIGGKARLALRPKKWNRRVLKAIGIVHTLLNYDMLYIGGGNAANVVLDLPDNVRLVSNDAGLTGGIRLWDKDVWQVARGGRARRARSTGSRTRRRRPIRPSRTLRDRV
jgi:polyphosphate glucokinase